MYHSESIKIYDALLSNIDTFVGSTVFTMGDISIQIEGKDGIGNLIEEWLSVWFKYNDFDADQVGGSQQFPDFLVGADRSSLEIKTFDGDKSPNFDLANFDSYCESMKDDESKTDCDYLIISYSLIGSTLRIKNIWLKKIWEITCPCSQYPLKVQQKRGVIYNIRPATWYSDNAKFKPFNSKWEFVNALQETLNIYNENKL